MRHLPRLELRTACRGPRDESAAHCGGTAAAVLVTLMALVLTAVPVHSATQRVAAVPAGGSQSKEVGPNEALEQLRLVRCGGARAVVRFGTGRLTVVAIGDRVGREKAEVKEVAAGRVVLEHRFTGGDGRPNLALIILKEGEKGGTRYVTRPEERQPAAARPKVIIPDQQ